MRLNFEKVQNFSYFWPFLAIFGHFSIIFPFQPFVVKNKPEIAKI
jgi:hypothetical protein